MDMSLNKPDAIRRRRGRPDDSAATGLDRGRLIGVLVDLVKREGVQAMSMRRLAAELGVSPRLLYSHIRDQQEMIELLGDAINNRHMPDLSSLDWEVRLRNIAESNRIAFAEVPGLSTLLLERAVGAVTQPSSSALKAAIREALRDAGLSSMFVDLFYLQFVVLVLGNIMLLESVDRALRPEADRAQVALSLQLGLGLFFESVRKVCESDCEVGQEP